MPQNFSMGCTTFCAEACSVAVKATNIVNDNWQMKSVIKNVNR